MSKEVMLCEGCGTTYRLGPTATLGYCPTCAAKEARYRCPGCGGRGRKVYGSTATWRGGIGGQTMTEDVCDKCWGTGRTDQIGADLRKMTGRIRALELEQKNLKEATAKDQESKKSINYWYRSAFDHTGKIRHDWECSYEGVAWVRVPVTWFENAPIKKKE